MRPIHRLLLVAVLAAIPATAQAQQQTPPPNRGGMQSPPNRGGMMMRMQSTTQLLLDNRSQLQLTAEQITKIEAIAAELEEQNKDLRDKLMQARGGNMMGQVSAEERAELMRKLMPLMDEIRKNDEAARDKVLALLNTEQKKAAREILEARARQQQGRRGGMGGGIGGGMRGGTGTGGGMSGGTGGGTGGY